MVFEKYLVEMEVSGEMGNFSRPDTGSNSKSDLIPSPNACKGMFENVFLFKAVSVIPVECRICFDVNFHFSPYNTHSIYAKGDCVKNGSATQILQTILFKPCYQIKAIVVPSGLSPVNPLCQKCNYSASYVAQFRRHLVKGDNRLPVFLGERSMCASYVGPFRPNTKINTSINAHIPKIVVTMYDRLVGGWKIDVKTKSIDIINGIAVYFQKHELLSLIEERCGDVK